MLAGLVVLLGAAVLWLPARAQDQKPPAQNVRVKKVPVHQHSVVSGELLYRSYCSPCHGMAAKGNGPAAPAFKTPPPDLTVLAKNNNGQFPGLKVQHVLEMGPDVPAHGSKDMPVWGPLFRGMGANSSLGHLRVVNVTDYLKSIQEK